jgi:TonB family protein
MTALESWILSYVVNSLWQVPLLFAAGLLAARALRSAGPEAEHRVWVGVMLLQIFLPACSAAQFAWLRTLLVWPAGTGSPGDAQVSVLMGAGFASGGFQFPSAVFSAITVTYGGVTLYFAARFIWRWMQLSAMRGESAPSSLTGDAASSWEKCAQRFGIRNASLATSARIFAPVTIGISRKLLLLPEGMASRLTEAEMQSVIAHEFAHMRRNDFLKNIVYELLSLPASYHPFLWFTRERITESREIVCDRMAADLAGRTRYSRSLLRLASMIAESAPARSAHAVGIFDTNTLERRLMKLAENRSEIRGLQRFAAIAGCLTLGAATCASALALHMRVNSEDAIPHPATKQSTPPAAVPASVMENQIISKVVPKYPPEAKKARIQGKVVLNAVIGKDGSVLDLKVDSGPKELRQSALDAVKQWKYKPYLFNGQPVEVATKINITYTLAK